MKLHQLRPGKSSGFSTFGCIWKKGECNEDTGYICRNEEKREIWLQSRITAYWPDGSVKWTAHTGDSAEMGQEVEILPRQGPDIIPEEQISIIEDQWGTVIAAGKTKVRINRDKGCLFDEIRYLGKTYLTDARAVLILEEPVVIEGRHGSLQKEYTGRVRSVLLEETGPLQAVIKYEGCHVADDGDEKFPFIIRMKVGLNSGRIDFTHTFIYDGDEEKDYLKGLGIRFHSPLKGPIYNRHVKCTADNGVFHESPVSLISWRPRVPDEIYAAQMRGEKLVLTGAEKETVDTVLQDTPCFSEYDICQSEVSHFSIRKKMKADNCCYLDCLHGVRSEGGAAFGSEYGSVLFAIRDFWEKYPSGYQIKNLEDDTAQATVWFWSPGAGAYDFRHYANRGYNQVCYEGYDYKGATPYGIACTNECSVALSEELIPSDEELIHFAEAVKNPPLFAGTPEYYHENRAFGYWSLPSHGSEMENWLEEQLEKAFVFYVNEVGQRNWYGMFNYGDFMHTYDKERHEWRYDIGGYAWDNTELVPTLWLWYYFMRTGREDVFSLAEKLSRHTSEVDIYHMGKYQGLGSRHNVRHWGCPCKEARIAMAGHHRFYYYMTGDRRMGDIFEEIKDNELSFLYKDPLGDFFDKEEMVYPSHARSGPDWSSLCSNWMTRWERFRDETYRKKIEIGIADIKKAPLKLVSGSDFEFDPKSVHLRYIGERATGGCHLQVCMGAPEIWMELGELLEDDEWNRMMADYGRFYYLPRAKQLEESGGLVADREFSLPFMASAMGAYGAHYLKDNALAVKTWQILLQALLHNGDHEGFQTRILENLGNRRELTEIPWISTNFTAQWCLNVIVVLEFIREYLPGSPEEADDLVKEI